MATGKLFTRGRKPRAGIHTPTAAFAKEDVTWASAESMEAEVEEDLRPVQSNST